MLNIFDLMVPRLKDCDKYNEKDNMKGRKKIYQMPITFIGGELIE